MGYAKDPRVDAYIDPCRTGSDGSARRFATSSTRPTPRSRRTIERSVQPYFVLQGNVIALLAAKDHVTVFLYDGGLAPDPEGIITGGHGNETGRFIAIREDDPINRPAMLAMFRAIVANNRAGGWRKLKNEA